MAIPFRPHLVMCMGFTAQAYLLEYLPTATTTTTKRRLCTTRRDETRVDIVTPGWWLLTGRWVAMHA